MLGNITIINPCRGLQHFLLMMILISYCTSKCLPETIPPCLGPVPAQAHAPLITDIDCSPVNWCGLPPEVSNGP